MHGKQIFVCEIFKQKRILIQLLTKYIYIYTVLSASQTFLGLELLNSKYEMEFLELGSCGSWLIYPKPDGYKNCAAVWLGVIYDLQATNRKQGGLPVRIPNSYWLHGSHISPLAGWKTQKHNPKYSRWKLLLFD
jgi:hypothetical protein